MKLIIKDKVIFYREREEYTGVIKIARKVRNDIKLVTGTMPPETDNQKSLGKYTVIYGTVGKSRLLEELEERKIIDLKEIKEKRESYLFWLVENPHPPVDCALVIAGSDKRGTIYGLFHLSEILGVSPLVNWSDVWPAKKDKVVLTEEVNFTSKEPSVRFRGFFINDEWPAFGTWANKRFGGVNAKMYEHVFELLLRLKGNYLWPAMWASIFSDEGPGLASAQLADELGVVMGMSHHEPCLRHGEEYKYLRGKDSPYKDAWNFRTNKEGITKFWEDGLKRSGHFENVITVGMRGEQDTAIMGKDATLADNIELLKDVIKIQKKLIKENVKGNQEKVPMMLALYKEVEAYFYGDKATPGLINSEELEDVILMFSDDNFGNLRTLPTGEMQGHKGGYGIYYHFDYHGWPFSFEWINSSYLPKVWEQMTTAYEFGIRDLWIVNVGDICTQEFPLSFFLDLAYDFDKWGTTALNTTDLYTRQWVDRQFSGYLQENELETICEILSEYTRIAHMRRPEAMNANVYHPAHYREADRMLLRVEKVIGKADELRGKMAENIFHAFYELVYYPAVGNMNLQKMHLLAGKNMFFAKHGRVEANVLAKQIGSCIQRDRKLSAEFHEINDGKWYGMGLSEHVGFVNWCEEECAYPLQVTFEPANKPRIIVSIPGISQQSMGGYWIGKTLYLNDFRRPDVKEAVIEIFCGSCQPAQYEISSNTPRLKLSAYKGSVKLTDRISVSINRNVPGAETQGEILVKSGRNMVKIIVPLLPFGEIAEPMTFVETNGYIAIEAEHYHTKGDTEKGEFKCLAGHGKTLSAMKVFPVTSSFKPGKDAPYLEYHFIAAKAGEYTAMLYMSPSNPVDNDAGICYGIEANHGEIREYNTIVEGQKVGDHQFPWADGVVKNIRNHESRIVCNNGLNTLRIYAVNPGFVLERIVLFPADSKLAASYLGPEESYYVK